MLGNHLKPSPLLDVNKEAQYQALWNEGVERSAPHVYQAIQGGVRADRMSWVFVAAYQAAIRWCFSDLVALQSVNNWLCFAVSEDRRSDSPKPGVTAEVLPDKAVLNGTKTWIAASDSVSSLVIKARADTGHTYWLLDRDLLGVTTKSFPTPQLLPEMSQGWCTLERVNLPLAMQLDSSRTPYFQNAEAAYLLASLTACLWNKFGSASQSSLQQRAEYALEEIERLAKSLESADFKTEYSKHHRKVRSLLECHINASTSEQSQRWKRDIKLLDMYARK